ncbi:hypothetical protein [Pseudoneobacillus sp. C159]
MLIEAKVKKGLVDDLEVGRIISVIFFPTLGDVYFRQSTQLLWEEGYKAFELFSFEKITFQFEAEDEVKILKEVANSKTKILYGCIVDPPINGAYYVTFHKDSEIIHELARVTIESRKNMLLEIQNKRLYDRHG